MTVNLLVDKSCSMDYKSRTASMTKWDYSRALVAAFLLFLHKQRDAASLGFVGRTLEELTRGGARASHYRRMMTLLHRDADDSESHLANSLNSLLPAVEMRSMILVFSDFYEDPKALKAPLSHLRHLKCEVLLFHILDPMEISFDFDEPLLLQELESEDKMRLSPDLVRDDYNESIRRHIDDISSLCVARDCEYLLLDTTVSPIHALGKYISKRRFMQ